MPRLKKQPGALIEQDLHYHNDDKAPAKKKRKLDNQSHDSGTDNNADSDAATASNAPLHPYQRVAPKPKQEQTNKAYNSKLWMPEIPIPDNTAPPLQKLGGFGSRAYTPAHAARISDRALIALIGRSKAAPLLNFPLKDYDATHVRRFGRDLVEYLQTTFVVNTTFPYTDRSAFDLEFSTRDDEMNDEQSPPPPDVDNAMYDNLEINDASDDKDDTSRGKKKQENINNDKFVMAFEQRACGVCPECIQSAAGVNTRPRNCEIQQAIKQSGLHGKRRLLKQFSQHGPEYVAAVELLDDLKKNRAAYEDSGISDQVYQEIKEKLESRIKLLEEVNEALQDGQGDDQELSFSDDEERNERTNEVGAVRRSRRLVDITTLEVEEQHDETERQADKSRQDFVNNKELDAASLQWIEPPQRLAKRHLVPKKFPNIAQEFDKLAEAEKKLQNDVMKHPSEVHPLTNLTVASEPKELVKGMPHERIVRQLEECAARGQYFYFVNEAEALSTQDERTKDGRYTCPLCLQQRHVDIKPCPVYQFSHATNIPQTEPECEHCKNNEGIGCGHCIFRHTRLVSQNTNSRLRDGKFYGKPTSYKTPWLEEIRPETQELMLGVQKVANAAVVDLNRPELDGRLTPKALLALGLIAEEAAAAKLRKNANPDNDE